MAEQPIALTGFRRTPDRVRPVAVPVVPWRLIPLLIVVIAVTIGPLLTASATTQSLADRLQPPLGFGGSSLGTDGLGRDLLARVLVGSRNSLQISLIAASGAAAVGILAGMLAGILGGWADRIVSLLVESVLAVPFITVGLMITATIGQSAPALITLLILTGWITHARILRAQAAVINTSEFVRAAQTMGAGRWHTMLRHILPNLVPIAIVVYFQQIGSMVLWSASLTWLGIGLPIDHISLGGIVRDGQELLYTGWWVSAFGGLAIVIIVTSLNLAADWLRLFLDPHTRGVRPQ